MTMPSLRPQNPNFSSGPCSKRPGWTTFALDNALLGRSHRSKPRKARLEQVIQKTRSLLNIPSDYRIGIVAASDTGAIEMAMWSMLGARGIDVLAWESFSQDWVTDIIKQLKLDDVRTFNADYGKLPDLTQVDSSRDTVFCWNGTTSGVCVPNGDWIADNREGLTFCDATSAAFAMDLPWDKLDVTTFSWQKVLGGEAQHGILILSPRAVERLESYTPSWPLPKIFRMTKGGKLNEAIFKGATINTPSMLCVEDCLDSLNWIESIGGINGAVQRSQANLQAVKTWVENTSWAEFLAENDETCSSTSICLTINDPSVNPKDIVSLLDQEGIAYDIGGYRDAPAGLRIWGGATVETRDIEALLPWIEWAFNQQKTAAAA